MTKKTFLKILFLLVLGSLLYLFWQPIASYTSAAANSLLALGADWLSAFWEFLWPKLKAFLIIFVVFSMIAAAFPGLGTALAYVLGGILALGLLPFFLVGFLLVSIAKGLFSLCFGKRKGAAQAKEESFNSSKAHSTGEKSREQASGAGQQKRPRPKTAHFDPYEVLGVSRAASPEEIKASYREKLMKYHPDRVNHLGEEFQVLAHQKTIAIKRAFEMTRG